MDFFSENTIVTTLPVYLCLFIQPNFIGVFCGRIQKLGTQNINENILEMANCRIILGTRGQ